MNDQNLNKEIKDKTFFEQLKTLFKSFFFKPKKEEKEKKRTKTTDDIYPMW